MEAVEWIAVDWGTTHLRAWAMSGRAVLAEACSAKGMGALRPDDFEPALRELIAPWLGEAPVRILACGMVGARQGWVEAPYRAVPCAPLKAGQTCKVPARDPRLRVEIVPGLSQADPADVMRGEETQIAGFLAAEPAFAGAAILPGTHSKWVHLSGGQVQGFHTAMTGELFALLASQSVLRHSVGAEGFDAAAFEAGVAAGLEGKALAQLFAIRASGLLAGTAPEAARARLSGLLIGAEIGAFGEGVSEAVVIGGAGLSAHYLRALALAGCNARALDGADLAREGLWALYEGAKHG